MAKEKPKTRKRSRRNVLIGQNSKRSVCQNQASTAPRQIVQPNQPERHQVSPVVPNQPVVQQPFDNNGPGGSGNDAIREPAEDGPIEQPRQPARQRVEPEFLIPPVFLIVPDYGLKIRLASSRNIDTTREDLVNGLRNRQYGRLAIIQFNQLVQCYLIAPWEQESTVSSSTDPPGEVPQDVMYYDSNGENVLAEGLLLFPSEEEEES